MLKAADEAVLVPQNPCAEGAGTESSIRVVDYNSNARQDSMCAAGVSKNGSWDECTAQFKSPVELNIVSVLVCKSELAQTIVHDT